VLMGFAFFTTLGLVGAIFYILQDVPVKTTMFLVGGLMERETGTLRLDKMGGLYEHRPLMALAFIVPAFSLAGFPPFPGFWGKLTLVQAGLEAQQWVLVAIALIVGLLTLLVVAQVWARAFWRTPEGMTLRSPESAGTQALLKGPVATLALALFVVGLYAQPLYALAQRAAVNLADTGPYIQAVLGS